MRKEYKKTVIDLGTGDGRFPYKHALKNINTLYIGIDPSDQFKAYQKKGNRKKLHNLEFFTGSIEILPAGLPKANELFINFPWGSLLEAVIKPTETIATVLSNLIKDSGKLTIILGYHIDNEPTETERLNLPELSASYIEGVIIKGFTNNSFELKELTRLSKEDLRKIETTWSKKLAFGTKRPFYKICFVKT